MLFPIRISRSLLILALLGAGTFASAQPGTVGAAQPAQLNIYPNPFDQELNILLPQPPSFMITVQLRDMQGSVVLEESLSTMMNMQVNTSDVLPGVYVMRLIAQRGKVFHQQQVQKLPVK